MATVTVHAQPNDPKSYVVKEIPAKQLVINGKGDNPHWKNAVAIADFIYPWENEEPPRTTFRALHDADWLYLLYHAIDPEIHVYVVKNDKMEVGASDRVEIFFRMDDRLITYYGLEIDPSGRVMDYTASYHRKFDMNWKWPTDQLLIKTSLQPDGYTVEVAISKESLRELGLLKSDKLEAGIYRGNCVELTGGEATLKWISWVRPDSETPDFHIPSSFGLFKLEN